MPDTPPREIDELIKAHLSRIDRKAPGFVDGLYLTGSVALGDFQPQHSDLDYVAVLSRTPEEKDFAALAAAHRETGDAREFDALYIPRSALADPPDDGERAPHCRGTEFHRDEPCGQLNPVTWLELRRYGVPVRGNDPASLGLPDRPERLKRWLLTNLAEYWISLADRVERVLSARAADSPTVGDTVTWIVTGPARLHYTLRTGDVTSKSGAGRYVQENFPEWAELAARCLRFRSGENPRFSATDGLRAVELTRRVHADAVRVWA